MLVREVRLFAGVVVLAVLVTTVLFVHLFEWDSGVLFTEREALASQLRPLDLRHRDKSAEVRVVEHENLSTNKNGSSSSLFNSLSAAARPLSLTPSSRRGAHLSSNISRHSPPTTNSQSTATLPTSLAVRHNMMVNASSRPVSLIHPTSPLPPDTNSSHDTHPLSLHHDTNTSLHATALRKHSVQYGSYNWSSSHHTQTSISSPTHQTASHPTSSTATTRPTTTTTTTTVVTATTATTRPTAATAVHTEQASSRGYVLTENYYEQQTMGLRNMMQLQCWAQSLKLQVVKPVMHDSFLRTPLDSGRQANFLKFEESFDLQEWSHQVERLGYAPLVPWSEFLAHAPRDVVLVSFEHPSVSMVKARQRSGQGLLHSPTSLQYTTGCSSKWPTASDSQFLRSKGFRVVRTVCFNFHYGDRLSLDTFNQHILGGYDPSSVTVIMETWRGISSAQRVLLKDVCQNTALLQEHISLSPSLTQKASQYIHKYLGGSQSYLAIMGRLEITQLTVHKKVPVVPYCLEETLSQWRQFKKETRLEKTFLAIDIGRYGSKKYRSNLDPGLEMAFRKFFQSLFGSSVTVKEWERRFELVAGNRDAGYIGLLQKVLVTRAQCILFVGGGAFQRHALYLYKQLHPDPRDQCYRIVKPCTHSSKLS